MNITKLNIFYQNSTFSCLTRVNVYKNKYISKKFIKIQLFHIWGECLQNKHISSKFNFFMSDKSLQKQIYFTKIHHFYARVRWMFTKIKQNSSFYVQHGEHWQKNIYFFKIHHFYVQLRWMLTKLNYMCYKGKCITKTNIYFIKIQFFYVELGWGLKQKNTYFFNI